jgi:hypothetical protein
MCRFIGIENITMNALIEVKERNYHKEVTFSKLLRYGKKRPAFLRQIQEKKRHY